MADRDPSRCMSCTAVLRIHCGSATCSWLRCCNARCTVENVDLDSGRWQHRDGHVEVMLV